MDIMKGFSNRWKDFPDYILGITHEIWEGRQLRTLDHYYAEKIPMRFPSGLVIGNRAVIDGTMATLAEFPDRELKGEDVIWSGDDETGYLSSHRILTTGTHLGDGAFGPATGQQFEIRAIADCAAKADVIYDEWLIRDVAGLAEQLGWEPKEYAAEMIRREGGSDKCMRPFTPDQDVNGGYHSRGNDNAWGERHASILTDIMEKRIDTIRTNYDRACSLGYPRIQFTHGWNEVESFWMGLRSSFPSAKFEIHHQIGRDDPMMPPRSAIRWSLTGKHEGFGTFGDPTGAEVHIMGMSHAEFGPYGNDDGTIRREYTLIDEVAVWKQILMHTGEFE
jgi:hypothetical protein